MAKQNNPFLITTTPGAAPGSRKVTNLPDTTYHADVTIQSCSMLKPLLVSPANYLLGLIEPHTPTASMEFGTLVHLTVLQPYLLASQVKVFPGEKDKRNSDYKEFVALNHGVMIVDAPTMRLAESAAYRIKEQKVMGRKFGDFLAEGESEVSFYYNDPVTGVECRTRPDLLHPEAIFDLKTTAYPGMHEWARHAISLSYEMQAYMYSLSECQFSGRAAALPFVFMCVENALPLSVSARRAGELFMREGERKYQQAITTFSSCKQIDYWPTVGGEEVIELEHWQCNPRVDLSWSTSDM